jgi:signal peptidase II
MRAKALLGVGAAVVAADQATKWLAVERLRGAAPVDIVPGLFRLDYAENTGGAFSVLAHSPWLLTGLSCLSMLLVAWFLKHTSLEQRGTRLGLGLLLGGALANLGDRVFRGFVVDFFDAYWAAYHWPTFNVADTAICVGAGLFVLFGMPEGLAGEDKPEQAAPEPEQAAPEPRPQPDKQRSSSKRKASRRASKA